MKIIKKLVQRNREIRKKQASQADILNQKAQLKIWEAQAKKEKDKEKYHKQYIYSRIKAIELDNGRRQYMKNHNED